MQTIPSASASDSARAMRNERKIVPLPRRVTPMSSNNLTPEVIKDVTISGIRDSNSLEPANPIPSGLRLVTDTISECRVATNCPRFAGCQQSFPLDLFPIICSYMDANSLCSTSLASKAFTHASLPYRLQSVTIGDIEHGEKLLSLIEQSSRIALLVRHVRLQPSPRPGVLAALGGIVLNTAPGSELAEQQKEDIRAREEFMLWVLNNIVSKLENIVRLSFINIIWNDPIRSGEKISPDLKFTDVPSLPLSRTVKHLTFVSCMMGQSASNNFIRRLVHLRRLDIDNSHIKSFSTPSMKNDFPHLHELALTESLWPTSIGINPWPHNSLEFINMSTLTKLSVVLRSINGPGAIDSVKITTKLKEAVSMEELELKISCLKGEDAEVLLSNTSLANMPHLRILQLGNLFGHSSAYQLIDTIRSSKLQLIEGECRYHTQTIEELMPAMKKINMALVQRLNSAQGLSDEFKLKFVVHTRRPRCSVLGHFREVFSGLGRKRVSIDLVWDIKN